MYKNDNNANIGIRGFTMWKQKNPVTKWYSPFWTNLVFACKTDTLGPYIVMMREPEIPS